MSSRRLSTAPAPGGAGDRLCTKGHLGLARPGLVPQASPQSSFSCDHCGFGHFIGIVGPGRYGMGTDILDRSPTMPLLPRGVCGLPSVSSLTHSLTRGVREVRVRGSGRSGEHVSRIVVTHAGPGPLHGWCILYHGPRSGIPKPWTSGDP